MAQGCSSGAHRLHHLGYPWVTVIDTCGQGATGGQWGERARPSGPQGLVWANHTERGPREPRASPGHAYQPEKSQEPAWSTDVYVRTHATHMCTQARTRAHTCNMYTHAHMPHTYTNPGQGLLHALLRAPLCARKHHEGRLLAGITGRRDSRPRPLAAARGSVSPEPAPPPSQPPLARWAHPAQAGSRPYCPRRCPCHHHSAASAAVSPCTAG